MSISSVESQAIADITAKFAGLSNEAKSFVASEISEVEKHFGTAILVALAIGFIAGLAVGLL